jgi:RIO-like serine/threonine protein kinase
MKIIFDEKRNIWKVELEDKRHSLNTTDFLVLTGLRDRNDRKFHHVSELIFTSRLAEPHLKRGLNNLKKTSLIHSKGSSYKISDIGEKVVDMIRRDEVEILNSKRNLLLSLDNLKRFLGFEAE